MGEFIIREARREDCKELKRLIQELADFEKKPDGPKIDVNAMLVGMHVVFQELAAFTQQPDAAKLNADTLEEDGFNSQRPYFHCFVAEPSTNQDSDAVVPDNGQSSDSEFREGSSLLGYALYFFAYSTWTGRSLHLEDLYVTPNCRGEGVGSALFDKVAKKGFQSGCSRVDFSVLDWNPAREFYQKKGALDLTEAEGWHHYRLEGAALERLGRKGGEES